MLRETLVIALIALTASACSVSRQAVNSATSSTVQDSRDSVRVEQVMVAVHDTIVETTTITIRENEVGDTIRMSRVTDRERVRDRSQVKEQQERVLVKTDTVFVAVRDSVSSSTFQGADNPSRASPLVSSLKWIFWIIIALAGLIVLIKVFKVFSLFHF